MFILKFMDLGGGGVTVNIYRERETKMYKCKKLYKKN